MLSILHRKPTRKSQNSFPFVKMAENLEVYQCTLRNIPIFSGFETPRRGVTGDDIQGAEGFADICSQSFKDGSFKKDGCP